MTQPRHCLSDAKWVLIEPHIPARKGRPGGDARLFLDALLWIGTTGSPWRDLPVFFGNWNHVYQRFTYWCDKGYFDAIFNALKKPYMEEEIMIDSISCKAHQASSGAEKSGPSQLASLVAA